jgi:DHA3 family macrolide efflux protein-like MFS transporter
MLSVFASKWKDITYMSMSLIVIGLTCVVSGVISKESFILFVILSFFMGSAAPFFNGPYMAMIQRAFDPAMLGRVISFITSVTLLCSPIGLLLAGPIVDRYGVQMWFFWSGVIIILTGAFLFIYFKRKRLDL